MTQSPSQRTKWVLTQQAFDQLLARLDPDRDRAARVYETIRSQLIEFFEGWGCVVSEDQADETINRVARIIEERGEMTNLNSGYFLGVARNILKEYWRKERKESTALGAHPSVSLAYHGESEEVHALERCMNQCLEQLPLTDREFILTYYEGEQREKIETRKKLAKHLKLTEWQLRKRAFRIRTWLKTCAENCFDEWRTGGNKSVFSVSKK